MYLIPLNNPLISLNNPINFKSLNKPRQKRYFVNHHSKPTQNGNSQKTATQVPLFVPERFGKLGRLLLRLPLSLDERHTAPLAALGPRHNQVETELEEAPGEDGEREEVHDLGLLHLGLVEQAEQVDDVGGEAHVDEEELGEGGAADVALGREPAAEDDQDEEGDLQADGDVLQLDVLLLEGKGRVGRDE